MKNRREVGWSVAATAAVLVVATLLPMVTASGPTNGNQAVPALADGKKKKEVTVEDFYKMDDPRAAAALLRDHARGLGVDIYKPHNVRDSHGEIPRAWQVMGVNLPGEYLVPDPNDSSFITTVKMLLAEGKPESEEIICVLQMQRDASVNDLASIMDQGIRIYVSVPTAAYIVRLRLDQIVLLSSQTYVRWITRYEPRFKLSKFSKNPVSVTVWSLDGDRPEFREDLHQLGGTEFKFYEGMDFYEFQLPLDANERLSELWWVFEIFWNRPGGVTEDGPH